MQTTSPDGVNVQVNPIAAGGSKPGGQPAPSNQVVLTKPMCIALAATAGLALFLAFIAVILAATGGGPPAVNTVASAALMDSSVTATKIGYGAVTSPKLAVDAVGTDALQADAVTSSILAPNSVSSAHLQASSVSSNALQSNSVDSFALATDAVTSNAIATDAVTSNALASSSVTSYALASGSVGSSHLQSGSVTSSKLASSSVTNSAIATGAVSTSEIASSSITASKLSSSAVTTAALADGAVTAAKLDSSAMLGPDQPYSGGSYPNAIAVGSSVSSATATVTPNGLFVLMKVSSGSSYNVVTMQCGDYACSGSPPMQTVATGVSVNGALAVMIGRDGKPYWTLYGANSVVLSTCTTARCSTASFVKSLTTNYPSAVAITDVGSAISGQAQPFVAVASGNALVTYACSDNTCTTVTAFTVATGGNFDITFVQLTIGTNGFPIITYGNDANKAAYAAYCTSITCSTVTTQVIDNTASEEDHNNPQFFMSPAVDFGFALYQSSANSNLYLARCTPLTTTKCAFDSAFGTTELLGLATNDEFGGYFDAAGIFHVIGFQSGSAAGGLSSGWYHFVCPNQACTGTATAARKVAPFMQLNDPKILGTPRGPVIFGVKSSQVVLISYPNQYASLGNP